MKEHKFIYGKFLPALMAASITLAGQTSVILLYAEDTAEQTTVKTEVDDTTAPSTDETLSTTESKLPEEKTPDSDSEPAQQPGAAIPKSPALKTAEDSTVLSELQTVLKSYVDGSKTSITFTLPTGLTKPTAKDNAIDNGEILKAGTITEVPGSAGTYSLTVSAAENADEAVSKLPADADSLTLGVICQKEGDTADTPVEYSVMYSLKPENSELAAKYVSTTPDPSIPVENTTDVKATLSVNGKDSVSKDTVVSAPFNISLRLSMADLEKAIDDAIAQLPEDTKLSTAFTLKAELTIPESLTWPDGSVTGEENPEEGPHFIIGEPKRTGSHLTVPIQFVTTDENGQVKEIPLDSVEAIRELTSQLHEGFAIDVNNVTPASSSDWSKPVEIAGAASGSVNIQSQTAGEEKPETLLDTKIKTEQPSSLSFSLSALTSVAKNYTVPMTLAIDGSSSENTDKTGVYQSPFGKMFSATAGIKADDLMKVMTSIENDLLKTVGLKEDETEFLHADTYKNLQLSYELNLPSGVLWNSKAGAIGLNTDVFTVDTETVQAKDGSIIVPLKMNPKKTYKDFQAVKTEIEKLTGGLLITVPGLQVSAAAIPGETMSLKGTLSGSAAFLQTVSTQAQTRANAPQKNVLFTANLQSNGTTAKVAASGERKADDVDMPLSLLIDNALKEKEVKAGQNFALTTAADLSKFGAAINDWLKTNAPKQANSENLDLNTMAKTPVLASDFDAVLEIKLPKGMKWDESAANVSLTNANFKIGDVDQAGQTVTLDLVLTKTLANMNQLKELADNLTSYKTMNVTLNKLSADSSARTNTKLPISASLFGSFDANVQNPTKQTDPLLDLQFDLDTETSNVVNIVVKPDDSGSSSSSSSSSSSTSSSKKVSGSSTKKQSSTSSTKKDSTKQSNVKTASATESQLFASLAAFAGFGIAAIAALKKKKD